MDQDEFNYWSARVTDATHGQLESVRKAATAWSALLTAVLGVFTTATIVSGLPGLDSIKAGFGLFLRGLILLGALLLLASVVLSGLASIAWPRITNDLTADTARASTKTAAVKALSRLQLSLKVGVAAAAVLFIGSALTVLAPTEPDPTPSVLLTTPNGVYCGHLQKDGSGALQIGGQSLGPSDSVQAISSCPAG